MAAAASPKRTRSAAWCFTVNNPEEYRPLWRPDQMAYLVWQVELSKTGTPHVQGYVRFKARKDLGAVKNCLRAPDAHLELPEGTEEQNRVYCTKEDSRIEVGEEHGEFIPEHGKQGRRSDLAKATDLIKKGTPIRSVAEQFPSDYVRYHSGLQAFADLVAPAPPLERPLEILVLWGPSGTGKTHRAMALMPNAYVVVGCGRDPFGRYTGELDLLIDEFQPEEWKLPLLLRILDKWKMPLDCRYRDRYAAWTRVIICSNLDPESWYANRMLYSEAQQSALRRRVNGCCRNATSKIGLPSSMENAPRWAELELGYLPTSLTTDPADQAPAAPVYQMDD